jgi:hypothetical protein
VTRALVVIIVDYLLLRYIESGGSRSRAITNVLRADGAVRVHLTSWKRGVAPTRVPKEAKSIGRGDR